jgi:hypothetical protein
MHWFLSFLIALPVMLIWFVLAATVVRAFGVRIPWSNRHDRIQALRNLTRKQYIVIFGVLNWGVGCAVLSFMTRLIGWRIWQDPAQQPTLFSFLGDLALWSVGGVAFGWSMWQAGHRGSA